MNSVRQLLQIPSFLVSFLPSLHPILLPSILPSSPTLSSFLLPPSLSAIIKHCPESPTSVLCLTLLNYSLKKLWEFSCLQILNRSFTC